MLQQVPAGSAPGSMLQVQTPSGQMVQFQVPAGVRAMHSNASQPASHLAGGLPVHLQSTVCWHSDTHSDTVYHVCLTVRFCVTCVTVFARGAAGSADSGADLTN